MTNKKNILLFSHMMKTAGTSVTKQLINYYGSKLYIVQGGLKWESGLIESLELNRLYKKNSKVEIFTGHPIRPYEQLNIPDVSLQWFTFLRNAEDRYLSHYLHDYAWTDGFNQSRYKSMREANIMEWERIENYNNYQTRFLAGELNLQKAIDILETRFSWVGNSDKYEESLISLNHFLPKECIRTPRRKRNSSLVDKEYKQSVKLYYGDFIEENNQLDSQLFQYFENNIWPKFKPKEGQSLNSESLLDINGGINFLQYLVARQFREKPPNINWKNFKRLYNRWFR